MAIPPRNLAPEQQAWGRYVEETLNDLLRSAKISKTNIKSTLQQANSATALAATTHTDVVSTQEAVGTVQREVSTKTGTAATPKPPLNPTHGDTWYDSSDGNKPYVYADFGPARRNYVFNPSFELGIDNWSVSGGSPSWGADQTLRATAYNSYMNINEMETRALPGIDQDEDGNLIGVPWSAQATVTVHASGASVEVNVRTGNDDLPMSTSPAIPVEAGVPVTITSISGGTTPSPVYVEIRVTDIADGTVVTVDQVLLEPVTQIVHPYFDGSTPGCTWEGARSASFSHWAGTPGWVPVQDFSAIDEVLAEADARIAAAVAEIDIAEATLDTLLPGDGPFREEVIDKIWSDVVTTRFLTATEKIITQDVIATGAVTAEKIAASEELTGKIVRGTMFEGRTFTGGTFTGSTFRTGTSGRRAEFTSINPFRVFNDASQAVFDLDSSGNIVMANSRLVAATVEANLDVMTNTATVAESRGVFLHPYRFILDNGGQWAGAGSSALPAIVGHVGDGSTAHNVDELTNLVLRAPTDLIFPYAPGPAEIRLGSRGLVHLKGNVLLDSARATTEFRISTSATGQPSLILNFDSAGSPVIWFAPKQSTDSTTPAIYMEGGTALTLRGATAGSVRVASGQAFEYYDPPTSTFAANVGISATPKDRLYRLTSARKYKINIEPFNEANSTRILTLHPRTWFDRTQVEEVIGKQKVTETPAGPRLPEQALNSLGLRRITGLVAEEVAEAGLTEYVMYNKDGEIDGVAYDRLWTPLIPIVRELWNDYVRRGGSTVPGSSSNKGAYR